MYREIRETPEALLKVRHKAEKLREIAESIVEKEIERIKKALIRAGIEV